MLGNWPCAASPYGSHSLRAYHYPNFYPTYRQQRWGTCRRQSYVDNRKRMQVRDQKWAAVMSRF